MKRIQLLALVLLLSITSLTQAQEVQIDTDLLIRETQITDTDDDKMQIVWWIPVEFWKGVMASDPSISEEDAQAVIAAFEPYTLLAIVDGEMGAFGDIEYKPLKKLEKDLSFMINGEKMEIIPTDDQDFTLQMILSVMAPMLENMLGDMGKNMHFFVYNDVDEEGNRIADPSKAIQVEVQLDEDNYNFPTPLASCIASKTCPEDGATMNGNWSFCPFHGVELK